MADLLPVLGQDLAGVLVAEHEVIDQLLLVLDLGGSLGLLQHLHLQPHLVTVNRYDIDIPSNIVVSIIFLLISNEMCSKLYYLHWVRNDN